MTTSELWPGATAYQPTRQPVFISYSGEDRSVAEKVCRLLELNDIDCWIAPRNIRAGGDYGEQIIAAIEAAPAMVLILSANANTSIFVANEVERAVSKSKALFVLRIGQVQPSPALQLLVSRSPWIDAWTPPLEPRVHVLAGAIRSLFGLPAIAVTAPRPASNLLSRRPLIGLGLAGLGLVVLATVALVGGLLPFAPPNPTSITSTPGLTPGPAGFHATGSMTAARGLLTATLLPGGRVLIAGGTEGSKALASAELYDPTTGTFGSTGTMTHARFDHAATMLANGRALVAGGLATSSGAVVAVASAELYDPATGKFSSTGSMAQARAYLTATTLTDGRVLIAGGTDGSAALASAELYDPKTGTFRPTGSMTRARYSHTATLLPDGTVLIAGGEALISGAVAALVSTELYDPTTGRFSTTGSMAQTRYWHTSTLLSDGRVLVAGGQYDDSGSGRSSGELYDPKAGSFSPTGSMAQARSMHTATLLPDGRVLLAGGQALESGAAAMLASAELYDPTTGTFSTAKSMAVARGVQSATLLSDGRVLIAGGSDESAALASAELYQP